MGQELTVKCPHCHQVAEIFLSTNACVVVLNCPSCCSPIMYFNQKIFILSDAQVEAIRNSAHSSSMMNFIKRMAEPQSNTSSSPPVNAVSQESPPPVPCKEVGGSVQPVKITIAADDIINLRIDLALCNDVNEFIERM